MGISGKLKTIFGNAKNDVEGVKTTENKRLDDKTKELTAASENFEASYRKAKEQFAENYEELGKREIVKSKLEFVDETGKTPAALRGTQVRILKKLREYFDLAIQQTETINATKAENARIENELTEMNRREASKKQIETITAEATTKVVKATGKFLRIMILIFTVLCLAAAAAVYIGKFTDPETSLIIYGAAGGAWALLIIIFIIVAMCLRKKYSKLLRQLADDYIKTWLEPYGTQYEQACKSIRTKLDAAKVIKDLEDDDDKYFKELTEYYLVFMPSNIFYIIDAVIEGVETGLPFGEAVWRSDDRISANTKHAEVIDSFKRVDQQLKLMNEYQYELLKANNKQIELQEKQIEEQKAQTAAIAVQTAATVAATAAVAANTSAINREAAALKSHSASIDRHADAVKDVSSALRG